FSMIAPQATKQLFSYKFHKSFNENEYYDRRIEKNLRAVLKSNYPVSFVNMSVNLAHLAKSKISDGVVDILMKLKERGVVIILAAGNKEQYLGDTKYTKSLAKLAEKMDGHLII